VALIAGMYLAYMGKSGLRAVAELCYHRAHYAAAEIDRLDNFKVISQGQFFNEFVVQCPKPVAEINQTLLENGILGGYDIQMDYPSANNQMLICVTELNDRAQIDKLTTALSNIT
jgi:glycine dehydrogenase subunit 1